jgi:uncharacterized damage-inducible protein DinB
MEEKMKELFEMYARYNQAGNKTIYGILDKLDNDEREKDRGSYYKSLSGIFRHILGGTRYFLGMFRAGLGSNAAAIKALAPLEGLSLPEGEEALTPAGWKGLGASLDTVDAAYVNMAAALTDGDLKLPLKLDWYGGNPAEVPLSFMLNQLVLHNTHHRGQVSQIFDSLKIDNDYSGINVQFLPR